MKIDKSWTLFLDRDGVINKRIPGGYVREWKHFEFLPGVKEAMKIFSGLFGHVIIVSNQQGIGKGIMTEKDLEKVHARMISEIERSGGRIDRIYHSPFLESEKSHFRKPNTGMADQAKKDFPDIDFSRSVMAGDSVSDIHFGQRKKMVTVLINADPDTDQAILAQADHVFTDLISFARSVKSPGRI